MQRERDKYSGSTRFTFDSNSLVAVRKKYHRLPHRDTLVAIERPIDDTIKGIPHHARIFEPLPRRFFDGYRLRIASLGHTPSSSA